MTDDPVDLDTRRSAEGRIAADIRRHSLKDFEADQRVSYSPSLGQYLA